MADMCKCVDNGVEELQRWQRYAAEERRARELVEERFKVERLRVEFYEGLALRAPQSRVHDEKF